MDVRRTDPPRRFEVVPGLELSEVARIRLEPDELVTFDAGDGAEFDFVAKDWGYWVTPSVNERLVRFGFRTALVMDAHGKRAVVAVRRDAMGSFERYLADHGERVEEWLDERGANGED